MEEAIMILIDNSYYVPEHGYVYKAQLEAIRLYARAKLKSNPHNRLGVATLGAGSTRWPHQPHSDIERFLTSTLDIPWGGEFSITCALHYSPLGFSSIPLGTKRRMVLFVAGCVGPGYLTDILLKFGNNLKKNDVTLDVVSFEHEDQELDAHKTKLLRSVVEAAKRDNNSHFARVPRHSSSSSGVREILVSSKILRRSEAEAVPLVEEVIPKMMNNNNNKKKLTRNRKKKNHHVQEDPEEEPVSSSSSRPPVILPAHVHVPQKQKQLVFGSWQMHQLLDVLSSPSS